MKQIPEKIYAPLLDAIDEKQYLNTLKDLLKAKKKTVKGKSDYECKVKLLRFGHSRGFEPKYIYSILNLEGDVPEEDED